MDVDGVEIIESPEDYGYSWRWDDARGFQSEILWNREVGECSLGTRVLPGGWTHNRLNSRTWGQARTIDEARGIVQSYVLQAAARPA